MSPCRKLCGPTLALEGETPPSSPPRSRTVTTTIPQPARRENNVGIVLSVRRPLVARSKDGVLKCEVSGFQVPVTFHWKLWKDRATDREPSGVASVPPPLEWKSGDASLTDAECGKYELRVVGADGREETTSVFVKPVLPRGAVVSSYEVIRNPTSSTSSDGVIRASGPGLDDCARFFWSNGVITASPCLTGLRSGTYSLTQATAVDEQASRDAASREIAPKTLVHACLPVSVRVASITEVRRTRRL